MALLAIVGAGAGIVGLIVGLAVTIDRAMK